MRVAIYVRPWSVRYYRYVAARLFPADAASFVSEHRIDGLDGFVDDFYRHYRALPADGEPSDLGRAACEEIVFRDRLLRTLPVAKAMRLIRAMQGAIEAYLDRVRPEFVLSIAIDNYVLDLLERCARRRGIPFFGIAVPTLDSHLLVTRRGERNPLRRPPEAEIEAVTAVLANRSFVPGYMKHYPGTNTAMLRRWRREVTKLPYFAAKRALARDPLNYHYWTSLKFAAARSRPNRLLAARWFDADWQDRVRAFAGRKLYLPLQLHPELNSEYWCRRMDFMPYEEGTLRAVDAVGGAALVLVKEHPAMLGVRDPRLYRSLAGRPNVVLAPVALPQVQMIEAADAVMTMNSSVGVEAFMRGKPVFATGEPYYAAGRRFCDVTSLGALGANLGNSLARMLAEPAPDADEIRAFVRHMLETCLPCDANEVWFDERNDLRRRKTDQAIETLRTHLPAWLSLARAELAAA